MLWGVMARLPADLPAWRVAVSWAVLGAVCIGPGVFALVRAVHQHPGSRF